jgi:hypothetical protein
MKKLPKDFIYEIIDFQEFVIVSLLVFFVENRLLTLQRRLVQLIVDLKST